MSDHFSGPRALAGPAGDISDLYAFPSPERSDRLVLGMMTQPLAPLEALYSDAIVYRFRMRPLTIEPEARKLSYGPAESELVFSCAFDEPRPHNGDATPAQVGWLTTPSGESVRFQVNDERGGQGNGVRVFAGVRSDPFFIDLPAYLESLARGQLAFKPKGQNSLTNANALGIVVELDTARFLQPAAARLWGMVAETIVAGKLPIRIERFGRPEIKNHLLSDKARDQVNRDLEVRDLYNLEDTFHLSGEYRGAYRARLNANLAAIDRLDGKVDWPLGEDGSHPLTDLLLDDYLVVDVSRPYTQDSYFDVERAMLEGRPHDTCGGRSMNDHTMDAIYTLLINAGSGPRISDGVDQATVRASDVFPYLAPPNAVVPDDLPIMGFVKSLGFQAATSGGAR